MIRWLVSKFRRIAATFLIAVFLAGFAAGAGGVEHVVLVSIDGLAAFHLENPDLELPNLRRLIREGVWAEGVEGVFPSVTHPSHTTIVTGVWPRFHGVIGNRLRNRVTGEQFHVTNLPHSESVRVPTIFDAARQRGLTTATFFWPESWRDSSIDFNIPEVFNEEGKAEISVAAPEFLEELRRAGVPIDLYYRWYGSQTLAGAADAVLAEAAAHVLKERRPQLLAIHLLATDVVQHEYGAGHYLAKAAISNADYCLGLLLRAVEEAGIADRTAFLVTADHGFHTVDYELNVAPLFEPLRGRLNLHPQRWTVFVELGESFDPRRDQPILEEIFARASRLEGISRVVRPEEFHGLGLPTYDEDVHVPGQFMLVADIDTHLVADSGDSSLQRRFRPQPYHGHGYLPTHPNMRAAFVAAGAGFRKGQRIGLIHQLDIAPTIALLLELGKVGDPDRALEQALTPRTR